MPHAPRLIHPVNVTIRPISKSTTTFDDNAREPVKQVSRSAEITVQAQVQWNRKDDPAANRGGIQEHSSGYLVFRVVDLTAASYTPQRGDRIITIGTLQTELDLYFTGFEPAGHYHGDNTMLVVNFEDRQPTRRAS